MDPCTLLGVAACIAVLVGAGYLAKLFIVVLLDMVAEVFAALGQICKHIGHSIAGVAIAIGHFIGSVAIAIHHFFCSAATALYHILFSRYTLLLTSILVGCVILAFIYIKMEGLPDAVSRYFNNKPADIILRSTSRAPLTERAILFKVTEQQLIRASIVFEDMLDVGQPEAQVGALPVVQMFESAAALELYLRFVLDSDAPAPRFAPAYDKETFASLLEVYDCGLKFDSRPLVVHIETLLLCVNVQAAKPIPLLTRLDLPPFYSAQIEARSTSLPVDKAILDFYVRLCRERSLDSRDRLAKMLASQGKTTWSYEEMKGIIGNLRGEDVSVLCNLYAHEGQASERPSSSYQIRSYVEI